MSASPCWAKALSSPIGRPSHRTSLFRFTAGDPAKTIVARYTDPDVSDVLRMASLKSRRPGRSASSSTTATAHAQLPAPAQHSKTSRRARKPSTASTTPSLMRRVASSTVHVTITVLGESPVATNRPPVASDIAIQVHADDSFKTILARFTDPDPSDAHTFSIGTTGTAWNRVIGQRRWHVQIQARFRVPTSRGGRQSQRRVQLYGHRCGGRELDSPRHRYGPGRKHRSSAIGRPSPRTSGHQGPCQGDAAKTIVARYTDPDVGDAHTISIDTRGTLGIVVDNGDGTSQLLSPAGAKLRTLRRARKPATVSTTRSRMRPAPVLRRMSSSP